MKADPALRRIPVVVLSTSNAAEDMFRSYDLHANAYITKPVDFDLSPTWSGNRRLFQRSPNSSNRLTRNLVVHDCSLFARLCCGMCYFSRGTEEKGAAMTGQHNGAMSIDGTLISAADMARMQAGEKLAPSQKQRKAARVIAAAH